MDAILFSARPTMVKVDDAIKHLSEHTSSRWMDLNLVKQKNQIWAAAKPARVLSARSSRSNSAKAAKIPKHKRHWV